MEFPRAFNEERRLGVRELAAAREIAAGAREKRDCCCRADCAA
jgi:hypothetical protein